MVYKHHIKGIPDSLHPLRHCCLCLFKVGFGYDRIARKINRSKRWVFCGIKILEKRGAVLTRVPIYRYGQKKKTYIPRSNRKKSTSSVKRQRRRLKGHLWAFFKHGLYPKKMPRLVGCSREDLQSWIQSQFKPGMKWSNYGKWHLDHIRPCSAFNILTESGAKECFHWTNLRPEWGRLNSSKSDKEITHQSMFRFNL